MLYVPCLFQNESRNHCKSSWLNSELAGMKVVKSVNIHTVDIVILSRNACRCNSFDCCCCCCSWISKTLRTSKVMESHKFNWEWLEDAFMVLWLKRLSPLIWRWHTQYTPLWSLLYFLFTLCTNNISWPGPKHLSELQSSPTSWPPNNCESTKKNGTSGTSWSTSKLLVVTAEKVPTASLILYKRQCHFGSLPQAGSRVSLKLGCKFQASSQYKP